MRGADLCVCVCVCVIESTYSFFDKWNPSAKALAVGAKQNHWLFRCGTGGRRGCAAADGRRTRRRTRARVASKSLCLRLSELCGTCLVHLACQCQCIGRGGAGPCCNVDGRVEKSKPACWKGSP